MVYGVSPQRFIELNRTFPKCLWGRGQFLPLDGPRPMQSIGVSGYARRAHPYRRPRNWLLGVAGAIQGNSSARGCGVQIRR